MAADLNVLVPAFKTAVGTLLERCGARGVEMRPYFTLRSPYEQARLWRQSRTTEEIVGKMAELRKAGAHFLVLCLESVGPQAGRHVTNAPPGFSWHQWGEAVDCFWAVSGRAEWSTQKKLKGHNGYRVYTELAAKLRLHAGGLWPRLKDWPHLQMRPEGSPAEIMTVEEIDAAMRERFGS
jgi:hypothetical protein